MSKQVIAEFLHFRPGTGTYIIGGFLLFLCMVLGSQYLSTGRVDFESMVDSGTGYKEFWVRNPKLEYLDSYSRTSLFLARERENGHVAMLDLTVVSNAEVRPQPCDNQIGGAGSLAYPQASQTACFTLIKPNGSSPAYRTAVSFVAKAKDSEIAKYYTDLFRGMKKKTNVVQDSSRAIVLEAEDGDQNTVVRVSIRSSFDTVYGFLAVTTAP